MDPHELCGEGGDTIVGVVPFPSFMVIPKYLTCFHSKQQIKEAHKKLELSKERKKEAR